MGSKTITLRVPDDVLEEFDRKVIAAGTNRSASIVTFMRTVAGLGGPRMVQGARVVACKHPDEKRERHDSYEMCTECGARVA